MEDFERERNGRKKLLGLKGNYSASGMERLRLDFLFFWFSFSFFSFHFSFLSHW